MEAPNGTRNGTARKTFRVGPLAMKIPRPMIVHALQEVTHFVHDGNWRDFAKWLRSPEDYVGMSHHLLRGWCKNIREADLSRALSGIVARTHLSLFGLLNFQERTDPLAIDKKRFAEFIQKHLGPEIVARDPHACSHRSTFGIVHRNDNGGEVVIDDYGGETFSDLVKKHRKEFQDLLHALTEEVAAHAAPKSV